VFRLSHRKYLFLVIAILITSVQHSFAGPPFNTDDPEPVGFKHWEYYISSVNSYQAGVWTGTSPHAEVNYGIIPNVQVHLLTPVNYQYSGQEGAEFGYADTEVGVKFRFVKETERRPQIGTFPIVLIPTVSNSSFSDGKTKLFLPLWAQKSWDKLTTYGGAGYWFNPGSGNKDWIFTGWEVQYEFSHLITLGGEIVYHSSSTVDGKSMTGFNMGGSINPSEKFHIIFSAGHSLTNESLFSSYFGFLWTI
jgi:hypothetical protein